MSKIDMEIKMIITDVDDTLLCRDKTVSGYTMWARNSKMENR